MSLRASCVLFGQTDTGKVREHNEDTIAFDADIGLLVLADGMGGYNAGEVASGIAVKTIVNLVRESVEREDLRIADQATGMSRASIILRDAIHRANKIIYQTARAQPQCEGMGTTVVAALLFDTRLPWRMSGIPACTVCATTSSSRSRWITRYCRSWSIAASIRRGGPAGRQQELYHPRPGRRGDRRGRNPGSPHAEG